MEESMYSLRPFIKCYVECLLITTAVDQSWDNDELDHNLTETARLLCNVELILTSVCASTYHLGLPDYGQQECNLPVVDWRGFTKTEADTFYTLSEPVQWSLLGHLQDIQCTRDEYQRPTVQPSFYMPLCLLRNTDRHRHQADPRRLGRWHCRGWWEVVPPRRHRVTIQDGESVREPDNRRAAHSWEPPTVTKLNARSQCVGT